MCPLKKNFRPFFKINWPSLKVLLTSDLNIKK